MIKKSSSTDNEKSRQHLLDECLRLKLPVTENDDYELLQLIYEAAKEKELEDLDYLNNRD